MKKMNKTILASVIAVVLANAFLAAPLLAQDMANDGGDQDAGAPAKSAKAVDGKSQAKLEAVTVTARRVEEQAQDVPLPVTAITAKTIDNKGYESVVDIARFTPGFTFHQSFGRTGDRPIIRGQVNILGEPNASFFIDGVFVSGDISGYDLSNLERVEVIRGPQSALFGRRTFAGAVNYITRRPGNEPHGGATLQFGNDGQEQVRLNYSAPISSTLAFGANAYYNKTDGLFYNTVSGQDDLGGQKTAAVGGSLYWHPSDSFDATFRMNYQHNQDQSPGYARYGLSASNCGGTATGQLYFGFAPIYTGRPYICGKLTTPRQFAINTPDFKFAGYGAGLDSTALRTTMALNWYFQNNWQLSSTTAYNSVDRYTAVDQDYSAVRGFSGAFETFDSQPTHDFSQEFRLASDASLPLHGLVGVYYYNQGKGYGFKGDLSGFNLYPGQSNNVAAPVLTSPLVPNATVENKAIFGLLEYRFNDHWKASAEIRYAKDSIGSSGVDNERLTINGVSTPLSRAYSNTVTFNSALPRFTLSYAVNDDLNFYLLTAKGNKPGGFNSSVEDARLTEASRQDLISQGLDRFKEESARTTELGMKSMWLDQRLRINADIFNINWTNQQLTTTAIGRLLNNTNLAESFITNIGESRVRGLELEGEFLLSPEWLMSFAYTHLDAKIVNYIDNDFLNYLGSNNAKGKVLPHVPENTAALGLTYQGELGNGWGLFGNADVNYEGTRYGDPTNLNETGSSTTFNFRFGIEPIKNLRVTAFVNNAFNNDTPDDILRYIDPAAPLIAFPNLVTGTGYSLNYPRDAVVTARMPRMFGIRLDYRF